MWDLGFIRNEKSGNGIILKQMTTFFCLNLHWQDSNWFWVDKNERLRRGRAITKRGKLGRGKLGGRGRRTRGRKRRIRRGSN